MSLTHNKPCRMFLIQTSPRPPNLHQKLTNMEGVVYTTIICRLKLIELQDNFNIIWVHHPSSLIYLLGGCFNILVPDLYSYPYEALRVVTEDGYVLHLERIPRYRILKMSKTFFLWTSFTSFALIIYKLASCFCTVVRYRRKEIMCERMPRNMCMLQLQNATNKEANIVWCRPNSQKVLYLQHGLLDSSLG